MNRRDTMSTVSDVREACEMINWQLREAGAKRKFRDTMQSEPAEERLEALHNVEVWVRALERRVVSARFAVQEFLAAERERLEVRS